jgi:uncharacterized protein (DUF849 family)
VPLLEAAFNGDRDHPAVPRAPDELAAEGRAAVHRARTVHHGEGMASWAVNRRGAACGHGIRTGLEDTAVLPDGRPASGNGELVAAAAALLRGQTP